MKSQINWQHLMIRSLLYLVYIVCIIKIILIPFDDPALTQTQIIINNWVEYLLILSVMVLTCFIYYLNDKKVKIAAAIKREQCSCSDGWIQDWNEEQQRSTIKPCPFCNP